MFKIMVVNSVLEAISFVKHQLSKGHTSLGEGLSSTRKLILIANDSFICKRKLKPQEVR